MELVEPPVRAERRLGAILFCHYPLAKSNIAKYLAPRSNSKTLSIRRSGYTSFLSTAFSCRYSTQNRQDPSFFQTKTTGEAQGSLVVDRHLLQPLADGCVLSHINGVCHLVRVPCRLHGQLEHLCVQSQCL